MLSIQTNVNSLVAQQNLNTNSIFQSKTIQQLTSGYRINSSGDDAAGLAVANKFRSSVAELTQGVSNGNDGVASLQIMDGGMNNIGQMLDRLKTLAMQSASDSFTGGATGRAQLNSEFQTDIAEIDRQAQSIGLNTGGTFAKSLAVYLGAGSGSTSAANSQVNVDLSNATVDSQSLGLSGTQTGNAAFDLSAKMISTIAAAANQVANTGYAQFLLSGPGFGTANSNSVAVNVNLAGVTDSTSLVAAVNSALTTAAIGNTGLTNAGITASIQTTATGTNKGNEALTFSSGNTAFQVRAGDQMGNAFLGNGTNTSGVATSLASTLTGTAFGGNMLAGDAVKVTFSGGGLTSPYTMATYTSTAASASVNATALAAAVNADATLKAAGITAANSGTLNFASANGSPLQVQIGGDLSNSLGYGNFVDKAATSITAATTFAADGTGVIAGGTLSFDLSVGGSATSRITITTLGTDTEAGILGLINAQIGAQTNNAWTQAGMIAADDTGGHIKFTSTNGTLFQLGVTDDATTTGTAGFAATKNVVATTQYTTAVTAANETSINQDSSGSYQLGTTSAGTATASPITFSAINYGSDRQTLTLSAADSSGQSHSVVVTLDNGTLAAGADQALSVDQAVANINTQIQANGDSTTQQVYAVAVKDGTTSKIQFESSVQNFSVNLSKTTTGAGLSNAGTQATTMSSVKIGTGGAVDISTVADAQAAVTAITAAVGILGSAQAAVGAGENQLNYAVSLAESEITNFSAAESNIRDANVAQEAANLTKAQVLQQASIAAMAQANSAPQAVLTLLRG